MLKNQKFGSVKHLKVWTMHRDKNNVLFITYLFNFVIIFFFKQIKCIFLFSFRNKKVPGG